MTILDKIVDAKKKAIEVLYAKGTQSFIDEASNVTDTRSFSGAIKQDGLSLIAEVKKASPSKGIIRDQFDPVIIAKDFEKSGARALSVLTEEAHFMGHPSYIKTIKACVHLPILRKDFIIDPIQVYESKAIGADAILLIKAILDIDTLQKLNRLAHDIGLDTLIEVHNATELNEVLTIESAQIIGVNNRNLNTFDVDTNTSVALFPKVHEKGRLFVAESGYDNTDELKRIDTAGVNAVLIGEGLAKHSDLINYFTKTKKG